MVRGLAARYIAGILARPERTIVILNAQRLLSADTSGWPWTTWRHDVSEPTGPAPDPLADEPPATYTDIARRLDEASSAIEREQLKREIISFFKRVDGALTDLTQLKEEIRALVDRYKQVRARRADAAPAPQFTGALPVVQADHLGASTYIEKGWSLISLGDHGGAIQALTSARCSSPPATPRRSRCSGWAQMLHEDYDDALATFSQVLMKEPANSLARINVGYICLKKRIFGEAIEHLSKAIRLDNDRKATLYAHFYLGLVYLEREMYEDAQSFFRKTLQLGPNLIEAYFELGRAHWFAGERDQRGGDLDRRAARPTGSTRGRSAAARCWSWRRRARSIPRALRFLRRTVARRAVAFARAALRPSAPCYRAMPRPGPVTRFRPGRQCHRRGSAGEQLNAAMALAEQADQPAGLAGAGPAEPAALPPASSRAMPPTLAALTGGRAPRWGAGITLPGPRLVILRADLDPAADASPRAGAPGAARRGARRVCRSGSTRATPHMRPGEWDLL